MNVYCSKAIIKTIDQLLEDLASQLSPCGTKSFVITESYFYACTLLTLIITPIELVIQKYFLTVHLIKDKNTKAEQQLLSK